MGKHKSTIRSLNDWLEQSPPAKGKAQWVPTRSAYELANAWMKNSEAAIPEALTKLLQSHVDTEKIKLEKGMPEKETRLDGYGQGRNHDLLLTGRVGEGTVIVAIEAKADESFGNLVGTYLAKTKLKSNIPKRINHLAEAIFGHEEILDLRYQLLHATAGTLIEAKLQNAEKAVLVIHQFNSESLSPKKVSDNNQNLNQFISRLIGTEVLVETGKLIGPIFVPGSEDVPGDTPLYID
jgi:hypothetical protein